VSSEEKENEKAIKDSMNNTGKKLRR